MPENTPNLDLYLKNPVTDGTDTFNIETMLNENFRKIDENSNDTSHVKYGSDTGTANAKVLTFSPIPTAYVEGTAVAFKNAIENTGAVTLNINSLGAKSVLKSDGTALASGNLKANSIYTLRYNGTSFILQGEGGGGIPESDRSSFVTSANSILGA